MFNYLNPSPNFISKEVMQDTPKQFNGLGWGELHSINGETTMVAKNWDSIYSFSEDGILKGVFGTTYYEPMTATSDYGEREITVKKGQFLHDVAKRCKGIISCPMLVVHKLK